MPISIFVPGARAGVPKGHVPADYLLAGCAGRAPTVRAATSRISQQPLRASVHVAGRERLAGQRCARAEPRRGRGRRVARGPRTGPDTH
eukprot:6381001-Prymnesium_polylepis.1